ncbi:MAG: ShlB/FhaC/HecB family hemolysin secretion/activation protein [Rhodospirillales bacterium]
MRVKPAIALLIVCGIVGAARIPMSRPALAQQAPSVPPALLPDIRLQRLPTPEPGAPQPEIERAVPAPGPPVPGAATVRFVLADIDIEGATVYPPDILEQAFTSLRGTQVTLADIHRVAKEIERRYKDDGYFLTRAIVPTQSVTDGRVRIVVLEGYVADVRIEGEVGGVESLLRSTLSIVTDQRPLRFSTLERALLLADDIPGIAVSGVLRPSADRLGAADLVVTATRAPFEAALLTDNFGDDYTGRWEIAASVASNSWTPFGERIGVVGFVTDPTTDRNQAVGQIGTSWHLGSGGLALDTVYSYGDSNPGSNIAAFDINSRTELIGAGLTYPLVRSRNLNLTGRLAFEAINTDVDIFGNETFSRDRLRTLIISATTDFRDELGGANTIEAAVRRGLPVFGATKRSDPQKSRPDGTSDATVLTGAVSRLQPLYDQFALYGIFAGQYAFTELLANEEFELGGTQFGRGYFFDTLSGDSGIGGTAELRYTIPLQLSYLDRVQAFTFFEGGQVWNRNGGGDDSLCSTGVGFRLFPTEQLFFELQMAKPLTLDSGRANGQRDPQVLFRAIGRL